MQVDDAFIKREKEPPPVPYSAIYASPLGRMLMRAEDGERLSALKFCDGDSVEAEAPQEPASSLPLFADVRRWLDIYFLGKAPPFTPPLFFGRGTGFQSLVWEQAMQIPYGKTASYSEIAARLAGKKASRGLCRAVGAALARNGIALIVPCHRVIGKSGALLGYAWGEARKQALLLHEAGAGVSW